MGEVGASSKAGIEMGFEKTETKSAAEMIQQRGTLAAEGGGSAGTAADTSSYSVVKWERFLPKMAVRVLLVEADDSTRQIIAALLRKCSYKVAAFSDGLKAWEVLRKGSENIDLILTEVELPSISGYALLTLMMEHDICKNIPVIMMSTQDSVNTVYKCMLRGAADFLVKPIRKNELRNLWQHVWRNQAKLRLAAGLGPPAESVAQENVEATAENTENNTICNHSSDAQSSCWKPDLETEGADTEQVNCLVREETTKCQVDDINSNAQEESHQELGHTRAYEDEAGDRNMKRANPSGSVNQVNDETKRLNHSEASAFSRYIGKSLLPHNSMSPSMCYQQNDHETDARKQLSRYIPDYNSDTRARRVVSQKLVSVIAIPSGQSETIHPLSQKREMSQPSPVRGVEVQNVTDAASLILQTQYAPSALPPPPVPAVNNYFRPFSQLNSFYPSDHQPLVSREFHNVTDLMISKTSDENQCKKLEVREDRERLSPGNDQSVNGSSFDGQASNFHGACSGSIGKINSISLGPKCGNEEGFNVHNEASHRSRQREAAITKFRMKRKDRCFEKKVRYESRKKLAEQRPRVKGQFVRQIASDAHQPWSSSAGC